MSQLIVFEGIDGSGKGTQSARFRDRLLAAGVSTALISFPRYQTTRFGERIGDFLNGRYGELDQVHPLLVSLLFAGDRFESRDRLRELLASHEVVVCDRYVPSNMAHQGAKVCERDLPDLLSWIETLEYEIYGLPRPDQVIWLDVPADVAQELIAKKSARAYTERAADLQEADGAYLQRVSSLYALLAGRDSSWKRIRGTSDGVLRSLEDIGDEIFELAGRRLPGRAS